MTDPEKSIIRIRCCRVLLFAYRFVNCSHISHNLSTFFKECGVMCSFDIQSNSTMLKRIVVKNEYDIIFLSREVLADWDFQNQLLGSPNRETPVIVYKNSLTKSSSPSKSIWIWIYDNCIAIHYLPLIPCTEPIDCIDKVNIFSELIIPFSVLDLAVELVKVVFLPAYLRFAINPAILEYKCRVTNDFFLSFFLILLIFHY